MTDTEKIAKIVAWMGGWPKHQDLDYAGADFACVRAAKCTVSSSTKCKAFNPFERIEDAFLVVGKLRDMGLHLTIQTFSNPSGYLAYSQKEPNLIFTDASPARVIAEAAFQVIERLEPK